MESENHPLVKQNEQNRIESNDPPEKEIKLTINNNITEPNQKSVIINTNKPIISSLFESKGRVNDLDFIWKLQIKKEQFMSSFNQFKSIKGRDKKENYIGLIYVFYHSSMSASLICIFQNGMKSNEEEFKRELQEVYNQFHINQESNIIHQEVNTSNNSLNALNHENGQARTISQSSSCKNNNSSMHSSSEVSSNKKKSSTSSLDGLRMGNDNNNNNMPTNPIDNNNSNSNNSSETNSLRSNNQTYENISHCDSEPSYDLTLNVTLIDYKTINASYKSIPKMIIKEMQLNTNCLMSLEEESIIMIDIKRSKNYPKSNKFIGLINEGMTCYMNSMIQSLNVLGYFKKGVFRMPFEGTNTVSYSLQRLFYELTFENELASTNRLIESFGWSRDLIYVQHDVQEFNMMLSDLMEKKMQGTKAEGSFKFLFEGKILNCIQCIDYDYTSKKEEIFNDLQLNVKGCKNIYESLNKFTEEEILDKEDKYLVEGHGKEKAKKMLKFLSLPPVLIFQLKRFEYNPKKDEMDKLNDYFEFESILDMSAYLPDDQKKDSQYALISIVVHRGNVHGGHYYSFIRSSINNHDWYCFNDEFVRKADLYEVFNMNYGGNYTLFRHREKGIISELHPCSDLSAYILIYIRVNQAELLLQQITIEDIPKDIIKAIFLDKEREKQEMLLRERKEKYMDIYLISREILYHYKGLGISRGNTKITLEPIVYEDSNYLTGINIHKNLKLKDLYNALISIYNCNHIDLFLFCMRNPNRITKRNDYAMHYLSEKYLDIEVSELLYVAKENTKIVKRVYLFISVRKNGSHFDPFVFKQDYSINEDSSFRFQSKQHDFLFFIPYTNKYEFNQVNKQNREFTLPHDAIILDNKKLFIMKRFDFINNTLEIYNTILIEKNNTSMLELLMKETLLYYQNQFKLKDLSKDKPMKTIYLIENTGIVYHLNKDSNEEDENNNALNGSFEEMNNVINYNTNNVSIDDSTFVNIIYSFSKLFKDNYDNDSFIIIPYVYYEEQQDSNTIPLLDQINRIYSIYKYQVVIPLCFSPIYSYLSIKLNDRMFYLNESDEMIKERVFNSLSNRDLFQILILEKDSNNGFIYNGNKQLISLTEYCQTLSTENLSLKKKINAESPEYPLLKYIGNFNKNAYEIEFEILTITERDSDEYTQLLLALIDNDFNTIADIDIHLPSNISFVSEIIEYIYEPILKLFYSQGNYTMKDFQMVYYYSSKNYILSSLPGKMNLKELNKKAMTILKYGLMPINGENEQSIVVKVAFQSSANITLCQPILLFEPRDVLVSKAKSDIFDKIQKMNKLTTNQTIDYKDIKKMKFYTYSIINYSMNKELLIISNKDNEELISLYKSSTYGLLVEFLPKINDN